MRRYMVFLIAAGLVLPAGAISAELKVAYISSQTLRDSLPEFDKIERQLKEMRAQREREIVDRQSELMKLEENYRKQEMLLSETKKAEMQAEFDEKMQKFQELTRKADRDLAQKQIELSSPVFARIDKALKAIGKEEGYDFIFNDAQGSPIVYADKKYDITIKLLARLRQQAQSRAVAQEDSTAE